MESIRTAATPGIDGQEEEDGEQDQDIVGADATRFRGVAARCNYLAFDRPDIQFATKEICREMSRPTTGSLRRLKRLGQYLRGKPRLVWNYEMQSGTQTLDVYTDSNWAGCRVSRKSTSGGVIMRGRHCLKAWSKTQAIVAKSSAEAELYGVVRGATEALGMTTLVRDLGGEEMQIQLHLDAMAAKGIVERRGLSKVRHIDVNVLWLQETCARKAIPMNKVPGEENCSDLMTKHLGGQSIIKNTDRMYMSFDIGRAEKAAKLHSIASESPWKSIRKAANDQRGGDRWKSRGAEGVWHRWHTSPRTSLFTPYKVAKGPASSLSLHQKRFTCAVTEDGEVHEFYDDWTKPDNAHKILERPWTGYTIFTERDAARA